ncbi:hypothetical protein [Alkalibacillus haloalkaliphilus]|uniref:Uncharacterized protein n=1 Tax=Alkalibacillus haloalkaliphilus TaxID=94136 RepID=A0A511W7R1_9BACI|nr:hypothetical protein [Alkalibacillus haloalkaliphilus]GEN47056.1 hypothetical protein AHA02nite_28320 [Alkalibacillus haloalkaliphilus]
MRKKILTGIVSVTALSFLTIGSVAASSAITASSCPPGQPSENCLERP